MNKITYQNKVDTKVSTLPEINKTTASTHNEVKTIVNQTIDQVELNIPAIALNTAKVVTGTFLSSLSSTLQMPNSVGSIPAGTTIGDLNTLTFTQYLENQNFPTVLAYISDNSNLTSSGFSTSLIEVGTGYSFTLIMGFDTGDIKNGDNTLAGSLSGNLQELRINLPNASQDYVNLSVSANSDSHTTSSYSITEGANVWTLSGVNSAGATTYTDNKGGTALVASIESSKADTVPNNITLSKVGRFPYIYGMSTNNNSTGGVSFYNDSGLSHDLNSNQSRTVTLNGSNEFIQYSYPSSYGSLTQILDNNGFDVTSSFTKHTVNVISSGKSTDWTESYFIYQTNSVTSVSNKQFQFIK